MDQYARPLESKHALNNHSIYKYMYLCLVKYYPCVHIYHYEGAPQLCINLVCSLLMSHRLENIKSLTFYNGKQTTGRRSSPVRQLVCIGGDACKGDHLYIYIYIVLG